LVWCLWQRKTKQAFIFAAVALTLVTPWFVHRHSERNIPSLLPGYGTQFWDRLATSDERVTWRALPARAYQNSSAILAADVGAMFAPSLYRNANESGSEVLNVSAAPLSRDFIGAGLGNMGSAWQTKLVSCVLSLIALFGFAQIVRSRPSAAELFFLTFCATAVIWPWAAFRLIFPVYPLFCLYLVAGVRWIASALRGLRAEPESAARIVLATFLGLFLLDHAVYILQTRGLTGTRVVPEFSRHFEQVKAASEWVRAHTAENAVVSGSNLPQVHLYSGRQVDYCRDQACEAAGIHYWVYETSIRDLPASAIVYDPGGGVMVLNADPSSLH
jgi:hypothetical protein